MKILQDNHAAPYIYLASPYTHADNVTRSQRFTAAGRAAAYIARMGHVVFSPIVHGWNLETHGLWGVEFSHKFWMRQCAPLLHNSKTMVLLPLQGWKDSKGVAEEIEYCHMTKKQIIEFPADFYAKAVGYGVDYPHTPLEPLSEHERQIYNILPWSNHV